ncbi:MAG: SH3 domain-containing protein [Saprospiraceae bacterium]
MKKTSKKGILFILLLVLFLPIACLNSNKDEINVNSPALNFKEDTSQQQATGFPILMPIDEISQNTNLQQTVKRIKYALKTKNVDSLLYYVADDVKISFSKNEPDFKTFWKLSNNSNASDIWELLENLLKLGGVFYNDKKFFIPYTFTYFPAEYNPNEFGVIISDNILMKEKPKTSSSTIGELTYEIVRIIPEKRNEKDKKNWVKIKRQNESVGYIRQAFIRRPIDYRLGFRKKNGEWKIDFLMNGR